MAIDRFGRLSIHDYARRRGGNPEFFSAHIINVKDVPESLGSVMPISLVVLSVEERSMPKEKIREHNLRDVLTIRIPKIGNLPVEYWLFVRFMKSNHIRVGLAADRGYRHIYWEFCE